MKIRKHWILLAFVAVVVSGAYVLDRLAPADVANFQSVFDEPQVAAAQANFTPADISRAINPNYKDLSEAE